MSSTIISQTIGSKVAVEVDIDLNTSHGLKSLCDATIANQILNNCLDSGASNIAKCGEMDHTGGAEAPKYRNADVSG